MRFLGVFAKYWTPGRVKTRLGRTVGDDAAAELHRSFVLTTLRRLSTSADQRRLFFAPADCEQQLRAEPPDAWALRAQCDGDLGRRMEAFFTACFDERAERVVLVGSDSPNLPTEYVEQSFAALTNHDIVIGPTEDGGYYLIGARIRTPPIFAGVHWGTPTVWSDTMQRIADSGLIHHELPMWYDIDFYDDMQRMWGDHQSDLSPLPADLADLIRRHLAG